MLKNAKHRRIAYAVLVMGIVIAALALGNVRLPASPQEIKNMEVFTKNMKTVCFGRFLLDIPRSSVQGNGDNYEYAFAKIEVSLKPYTLDQFNVEIDKKIQELKLKKNYEGRVFFSTDEEILPSVRLISFFGNEGYERKINGFVLNKNTQFLISGNALNENHMRDFKREFVALAPHLKSLPQDAIPPEPGFCMNGGYIASSDKRGETLNGGFTLPERQELSFLVHTNTNDDKVASGILDRHDSVVKQMGSAMADIKILRKVRRTINGLEAQERIVKQSPGQYWEYEFSMEIPGKPNSNAEPRISLTMSLDGIKDDNGNVAPVKFNENEAILLWDAITKTLRPRPGAL